MADSVKIKIVGDDKEFQVTLQGIEGKVSKVLGKVGKKSLSFFKSIATWDLLKKGISAVTSGLQDAAQAGMSFEAGMSEVQAISGATGEELQRLTETAKEYGATTAFTATQASEALKYMALAGWDANQSIDALGGVLNLAAASGMDLGAASDAVTDYLTAFGMEASQATYLADLMAYAQSKANTTAAGLADAYGNCAAAMHAAGQDVETTTAMLMALANQGVKGSEAGTQMAAVVRDITQKMKDGKIMIGNTAVTVADAAGNFRDLSEIMTDVEAAINGMGTAEASAALMETFTARSVKAVQMMTTESMASINAYEDALRGSEGTALQQSEVMLDNLQGDITIFKSALEGLQITAYDSFSGIARNLVQEGTGILEALNKAGKTGGISGMADELFAQIPNLLPKVVDGAKKLLSGLMAKLPSLIKNLVNQIPKLLGSIGELIPKLTDSATEAVGAVLEGVVANLPEILANLVPTLLKEIGKSLFEIPMSLTKSLFDGVKGALKKGGLIGKDFNDLVNDAFANVDEVKLDSIPVSDIQLGPVSIDGEIDTTAYTDKINTAIETIRTTISGLGLDETQQAELEEAIISGSGADALQTALESLGVSEATAKAVAPKIQEAMSALHDALADPNIGLTEDQQQKVADYVAAGGDLEEALTIFGGLSPEAAASAAARIQPALTNLEEVLNGLDIDVGTFESACVSTNGDIVAALELLGVDDEGIQQALTAMSQTSKTISARATVLKSRLKRIFTDGLANDGETAETASEAVSAMYTQMMKDIDEWEAGAIEQLSTMNLTAEQMAEKTKAIRDEADGMRSECDAAIEGVQTWITENADAATSVVQEHLDQLDLLMQQVEDLDARIQTLKNSVNPADYAVRTAVESGSVTSTKLQGDAFQLTSKEKELAIAQAEEDQKEAMATALSDYEKAIEEYKKKQQALDEKYAEDRDNPQYDIESKALEGEMSLATEAYDAAVKKAEEDYAAAKEEAISNYEAHVKAIILGIMRANGELDSAASEYLDESQLILDRLQLFRALSDQSMSENGFAGITPEEFLNSLGFSPEQIEAIAASMKTDVEGLYFDLNQLFNGILQPEDFALSGMDNTLGGIIDQAAGSIDYKTVAESLTFAMQNGWLDAVNGINIKDEDSRNVFLQKLIEEFVTGDYVLPDPVNVEVPVEVEPEPGAAEKAEQAAETTVEGVPDAMDTSSETTTSGTQTMNGYINGLKSKRGELLSLADELASIVPNRMRSVLVIQSPSKVMKEIGAYTGEGFGIGLETHLRSAVANAENIVGALNLKPKMDFSAITGSLGNIEQQVGEESQREINLYVAGDKLATTTAPFNNSALNHYANEINMGYGRG